MEEERLETSLAIGSLLALLALWLLLPLILPAAEPPARSPRAEIVSAR